MSLNFNVNQFTLNVIKEFFRKRDRKAVFQRRALAVFCIFVFHNAQRKLNNGMCKLCGSLAILAFQRCCPHRHVSLRRRRAWNIMMARRRKWKLSSFGVAAITSLDCFKYARSCRCQHGNHRFSLVFRPILESILWVN